MDSLLKERLERLGQIPAVSHALSGSPASFILALASGRMVPKTISATRALVRRGMPLLTAKRTIERLLLDRRVIVDLPMVEDTDVLTAELADAGIHAQGTVQPKQPG